MPLESYIDFSITQNKICHYIEHDFICGNSYPEVAINDSDAIVLRELYDVKEQGKMVYLYDYFIYCNGGGTEDLGSKPGFRKILLEEGMAAHSNIRAWRIPCTEEPRRLQSKG